MILLKKDLQQESLERLLRSFHEMVELIDKVRMEDVKSKLWLADKIEQVSQEIDTRQDKEWSWA